MELTCPKCHGAMRSYERNSVTVDQCTECRGIFLDRGELDRLVDAENRWHGEPEPASTASSSSPLGAAPAAGLGGVVSDVLRQAQVARSSSSGHGSYSSHGKKHKKKSFLDDLFG
jgi:Zn-finger nucleic acid-binding protein